MVEDMQVLPPNSMLHRVTSAIRSAAVLRICDFPRLDGDRPHVCFLCISAAFAPRTATVLEVRSGCAPCKGGAFQWV